MAIKPARPRGKFHFGWRGLAVALLTIIGLVSLTGFTLAHWTERQILTTDNWVQVVGPLPQDDQVASALSTTAVNKVFTVTDLENRITQALPDPASFLAPPLTDQLESRLTARTKDFIQSDTFTTIWTNANRVASERLLARARGETTPGSQKVANFKLNLSQLKDKVNSLVNKSSQDVPERSISTPDVAISVDLKNTFTRFSSYVKAVDFLNGTLGLLAVVSLVGAGVLTYNRRRLLMIISLSVLVISLVQLISVNALKPVILSEIHNAANQPAVGVVYDTLLAMFKSTATVMAVVSALAFIVVLITRSDYIARNKTLLREQRTILNSRLWQSWQTVRRWLRQYVLPLAGAIVLIGLLIMAVAHNLDWQGVIRSVLFIVLGIEILCLLAKRHQGAPMKH